MDEVRKSYKIYGAFFALAGYSQYTVMEYQNANYPEAKKALLQFIATLDEVKKLKDIDSFDYRMCQVDTILTYGRLAILEEKHGNPSESEKYMSNATVICQDVKWKDCSSNKIRQFVDRLDSNLKDKK